MISPKQVRLNTKREEDEAESKVVSALSEVTKTYRSLSNKQEDEADKLPVTGTKTVKNPVASQKTEAVKSTASATGTKTAETKKATGTTGKTKAQLNLFRTQNAVGITAEKQAALEEQKKKYEQQQTAKEQTGPVYIPEKAGVNENAADNTVHAENKAEESARTANIAAGNTEAYTVDTEPKEEAAEIAEETGLKETGKTNLRIPDFTTRARDTAEKGASQLDIYGKEQNASRGGYTVTAEEAAKNAGWDSEKLAAMDSTFEKLGLPKNGLNALTVRKSTLDTAYKIQTGKIPNLDSYAERQLRQYETEANSQGYIDAVQTVQDAPQTIEVLETYASMFDDFIAGNGTEEVFALLVNEDPDFQTAVESYQQSMEDLTANHEERIAQLDRLYGQGGVSKTAYDEAVKLANEEYQESANSIKATFDQETKDCAEDWHKGIEEERTKLEAAQKVKGKTDSKLNAVKRYAEIDGLLTGGQGGYAEKAKNADVTDLAEYAASVNTDRADGNDQTASPWYMLSDSNAAVSSPYADGTLTKADYYAADIADMEAELELCNKTMSQLSALYSNGNKDVKDTLDNLYWKHDRLEKALTVEKAYQAYETDAAVKAEAHEAYVSDTNSGNKWTVAKKEGLENLESTEGDKTSRYYYMKSLEEGGTVLTEEDYQKAIIEDLQNPNIAEYVDVTYFATEEEKEMYSYLLKAEGQEAADAFSESLTPQLYMRQSNYLTQTAAENAVEHPWASMIVGTLDKSFIAGYKALATEIEQIIDPQANVDAYDPAYARLTADVVGAQTGKETIVDDTAKSWQWLVKFGLDTGLTTLEQIPSLIVGGAGSTVKNQVVSKLMKLAAIGSMVAPNEAAEIRQGAAEGKTDSQIATEAIVDSLSEFLTEYLPLDSQMDAIFGKGGIKQMLKAGAGEMLEEFVNPYVKDYLDTVAEELSDFEYRTGRKEAIAEARSEGMTQLEAEKYVDKATFKEAVYNGLSAFLSASVLAAPNTVKSIRAESKARKAANATVFDTASTDFVESEDTQVNVDEALDKANDFDENTVAIGSLVQSVIALNQAAQTESKVAEALNIIKGESGEIFEPETLNETADYNREEYAIEAEKASIRQEGENLANALEIATQNVKEARAAEKEAHKALDALKNTDDAEAIAEAQAVLDNAKEARRAAEKAKSEAQFNAEFNQLEAEETGANEVVYQPDLNTHLNGIFANIVDSFGKDNVIATIRQFNALSSQSRQTVGNVNALLTASMMPASTTANQIANEMLEGIKAVTVDSVTELKAATDEALRNEAVDEYIEGKLTDIEVDESIAEQMAENGDAVKLEEMERNLEQQNEKVGEAYNAVQEATDDLEKARNAYEESKQTNDNNAIIEAFNNLKVTRANYDSTVATFETERITANDMETELKDTSNEMLNNARKIALETINANKANASEVQTTPQTANLVSESTDSGVPGVQALYDVDGTTAIPQNNKSNVNVTDVQPLQARTGSTDNAGGTQNSGAVMNPIDIAKQFAADLNVPLYQARRGLHTSNNVLGYFHTVLKHVVVKESEMSNFRVTMHESFHALADKIGMTGTDTMVNNLPDAFKKNYSSSVLRDEAFAEFGARYMVSETDAEAFAGRDFINQFETALRKNGLYDTVMEARRATQAYVSATAIDKVKSAITTRSKEAKAKKMLTMQGDVQAVSTEFITNTFDWTRPLYDIDKAAKANGNQSNVQAYAKRRNFSTRVATNMFNNYISDIDGNRIGDSFSSAFDGIEGKNVEDFKEYWLLKHGLDRMHQGKAIFEDSVTEADLQNAIAEYENEHPEYQEALKKFEGLWNTFVQAWVVDQGRLSQEEFDLMKKMYPNYCPTFRAVEKGVTPSKITKAKKSSLKIIDPIMSIAEYTRSFVDAAQKNRAKVEFVNAYDSNEGFGQFARELYNVSEVKNLAKNADPVASGTALTSEDALNDAMQFAKAQDEAPTGTDPYVMTVKMSDGRTRAFQFSDKLIYEALTGKGKGVAPRWLNGIGKLTNIMSAFATSYSPAFSASNPIRDIMGAINYGSFSYSIPDGVYKWIKAAVDVAKNDVFGKEVSKVQEYNALGGDGEYGRIDTGTEQGELEVNNAFFKKYWKSSGKNTAKQVADTAFKVMTFQHLNALLEKTTRYAEYAYGTQETDTAEGKLKAFQNSQNVSTDFQSGGKGEGVAALRKVIPFLNPNLQGTYRAATELDVNNRGRFAKRMACRLANYSMLAAFGMLLRSRYSSDDDKELYNDLADEMKVGYLVIPNLVDDDSDRRFIRIPISQDPIDRMVYGLIQSAVEEGSGTDDFSALALTTAASILDDTTLGVSDVLTEDTIEGKMNGLMSNTVVGPLWGAATNQTYYGSSIVSDYMQELPVASQYDEDTAGIYKTVGNLLNLSPTIVQYLWEQYAGYGGQTLVSFASGESDIVSSFLNSFHKRFTIDPANTNDISDTYSEYTDYIDSFISAVKRTGADGGSLRDGLTEDEKSDAYDEAVDMNAKGGIIYNTDEAINEAWKEIRSITDNETLTDDQKNALILQQRDKIADLQATANEAIGEWNTKYVSGESWLTQVLNAVKGTTEQEVYARTDWDKLEGVFAENKNQTYMQRTNEVGTVPKAYNTFTQNGVDYTVEDSYWDTFCRAYNTAYKAAIDKVTDEEWNKMSETEKKSVISKAKSAGTSAAKKQYIADHKKN